MKVKASPELGKLLTRAVEALETIAAAHSAEERSENHHFEPPAIPRYEWVYSSSEGWQLVPDEETADSEATEEVSGTMQLDVGPLDRREPGKAGRRSGLLLPYDSHEGVERRSIPERRKPEARWMGEDRRNSAQATRRDGDAERRQGDDRRIIVEVQKTPVPRSVTRRQGDRIPGCLPRRQEGDDLRGRRETDQQVMADLFGEKFDDLVGVRGATIPPLDRQSLVYNALSDEWVPNETPDGFFIDVERLKERRSPPANRRSETQQRMRTRRRPHDRRKRALGPGWLENMRSGEERRDGIDLRTGLERRFNDGRREADS